MRYRGYLCKAINFERAGDENEITFYWLVDMKNRTMWAYR